MLSPSRSEKPASTQEQPRPLVVQYLYVHAPGESFEYPSSRSHGGVGRLAARYLECVLVQAASLRLRGVECDLAFVTNTNDASTLGRRGAQLLGQIAGLGVEIVLADYAHRPHAEVKRFASSRYVFDAILAACARRSPDTTLWLVDVDCVWLDAPKVFAATPRSPALGATHIPYPPDWAFREFTLRSVAELAVEMGAPEDSLRWVGGELLAGGVGDLRALVATCEELELEVTELGHQLATEEQLLSLAAALGRTRFEDLTAVARRIWTGPRHDAPPVADPGSLGLLHLPSEKGLAFRRAARAIGAGRTERFVRDLELPSRALRRFNVEGTGWARQLRDDGWLALQRVHERLLSRLD